MSFFNKRKKPENAYIEPGDEDRFFKSWDRLGQDERNFLTDAWGIRQKHLNDEITTEQSETMSSELESIYPLVLSKDSPNKDLLWDTYRQGRPEVSNKNPGVERRR
jgi:hypothetical protein